MLKNEDVDAHKVLKKGWHDQNGFHCKLNVIQAYMKLYVMQGLRVGIREWVSRY